MRSRFVMVNGAMATALIVAAQTMSGQVYAGGESANVMHKHVETHPSQGDVRTIDGAEATLVTTKDGAFVSMSTRELTPGNAYTMWFVAINEPDKCETSPCKAPDVLQRTALTKSDVGYADGLVANADGTGRFAAHMPVGALPNAWFGNGYENAQGAEIHIVINDHGPLIADKLETMLGSYRGGCTTESLPAPFPDTAKSDGEPGPNTCRLIQDVIFVQGETMSQ